MPSHLIVVGTSAGGLSPPTPTASSWPNSKVERLAENETDTNLRREFLPNGSPGTVVTPED